MHRITLLALLLLTAPLLAADPESTAFKSLQDLYQQSGAGPDSPTPQHIALRRAAGPKAAAAAQKFLADFPNSEHIADAKLYLNIALYRAALAGDTNSLAQLQKRAQFVIADPKASDDDKQQLASLRYMAEWGLKNNQPHINEGTEPHRMVWIESLFAAADAVPNKESILQSILLEARAGYKITKTHSRIYAERVLKHPAANDFIRTEAQKILSGKPPYEIGKPIEIQFTATDGREINLAKLKGKLVLIDFWATWCGPCVGEFPRLKKTYETYHDRGLEVLSISLDDDRKALDKFLQAKGPAPWPHYFDGKGWNNAVSFPFGINAVPRLFLVDTNGILISTSLSYFEDMFLVEPFLPK